MQLDRQRHLTTNNQCCTFATEPTKRPIVNQQLIKFRQAIKGSFRDLLPIIVVIAFFQFLVLQQPIPNFFDILIGNALVLVGLTFFIQGLEMGLFPIGESMAYAFAKKAAYSGCLYLPLSWVLVPPSG